MLLKNAPATVFLATAQSDAALTFYRDKLGLEFCADEPYALVFRGSGYELRLSKVPQHTPLPFTVLDWQVDNILAAIHCLTEAGIKPAVFDGLDTDANDIWTSPDGGAQIYWFKDPDGNVLSISQRS